MVAQTAFGIPFACARRFAELTEPASDAPEGASVSIEWRDIPARLVHPTGRESWWQTTHDAYLLHVPGVAGFHVTAGTIAVQPEAGADDAAVRLYLFGSVMGALLHLRDRLPLHGSAVHLLRQDVAAIFTGMSTAGKSTLAAALAGRGYRLMADDIAALDPHPGGILLQPGLAHSKLWRRSLDFLALDPAGGKLVRPDKYALPMPVAPAPARVGFVYELHFGEAVALTEVVGMEKLRLLDRQTFRRNYVHGFGRSGAHLQRLAALAGQVRTCRITRPPGETMTVDAIIDLLERDWAG